MSRGEAKEQLFSEHLLYASCQLQQQIYIHCLFPLIPEATS